MFDNLSDRLGNVFDRLRGRGALSETDVREAMREKEPAFAQQGLGDPSLPDDALLDAMVATPVLINRPFVFSPRGVRLCRPPEKVLELLPAG